VAWPLGDGSRLTLHLNLGDAAASAGANCGRALYALPEDAAAALGNGRLPPWSCVWHLEEKIAS
jgi:hypothetical protein